jgi:hypothetical protein
MEAISALYLEMMHDQDMQRELLSVSGADFPRVFAELGQSRGHAISEAEIHDILGASNGVTEIDDASLDMVMGGSAPVTASAGLAAIGATLNLPPIN